MKQSLENLTLSDLENLIESIVKKVLTQETNTDSQKLLTTFNTWQDDRNDLEIIEEIYNSRNSNFD
jgi:hypothetical protein